MKHGEEDETISNYKQITKANIDKMTTNTINVEMRERTCKDYKCLTNLLVIYSEFNGVNFILNFIYSINSPELIKLHLYCKSIQVEGEGGGGGGGE